MSRPCTVCIHPDHETIDQELLKGTPYRVLGKRYGVGVSSVFRHRRDHLTEVMAKALEAREVRDLKHGDDMLGQLQFLHQKTLSILEDAEASGDRRVALAAIREARGNVELTAKLTGELVERHAHLHGHQMLSPEAQQQFVDAMSSLKGVLEQLPPKGSIHNDPHLLEGEAALPRAVRLEDAG